MWLSIIVSVIWLGAAWLNMGLKMRLFNVLDKIKNKGYKINPWTSWGALKDLKKIANTAEDKAVRGDAETAIELRRNADWVVWGALILIILIFILNHFFKWKE